jgi:hypothetical protein
MLSLGFIAVLVIGMNDLFGVRYMVNGQRGQEFRLECDYSNGESKEFVGTAPRGGVSLDRNLVPERCLATNTGKNDMIFEFNYTADKKRIRRLTKEVEAGETALFDFSDAARSIQREEIAPGIAEREKLELELQRLSSEEKKGESSTSVKVRKDKVLLEQKF